MINLPGAFEKTSSIELMTDFSLGVYPSFSAFVESARRRSTPSSPIRAILLNEISVSTGVKSILKSPVVTTQP